MSSDCLGATVLTGKPDCTESAFALLKCNDETSLVLSKGTFLNADQYTWVFQVCKGIAWNNYLGRICCFVFSGKIESSLNSNSVLSTAYFLCTQNMSIVIWNLANLS